MIWLLERVKIIVRHMHAFWYIFLTKYFKRRCEIFSLTLATSRNLSLTLRSFIQRGQHGIIAKHLIYRKVILKWRFCCSFLSSLIKHTSARSCPIVYSCSQTHGAIGDKLNKDGKDPVGEYAVKPRPFYSSLPGILESLKLCKSMVWHRFWLGRLRPRLCLGEDAFH